MKKIKIDFVDFWKENFDKEDNFFTNRLRRYYDVEISKDPDYVFCSVFGDKHLEYPHCVKIHFTGENIVADFNLYDYACGFQDITFGDRSLRLPLYVLYDKAVKAALNKHTFSDEYYLGKKKFCNRVVSNPNAAPERDAMYELLGKYKKIDSGGRYSNNIGHGVSDKLAFEKDYRFTLSFENTSMKGYCTEKILEAFAGDTIPIYWGAPDVAEDFNPDAFINCMAYDSFEEVVERIRQVNEDDELFLRMIKAPIVREDSRAAAYFKDDYADAFLRNIFDQDLKSAKRRNMTYIGWYYQKKMRDAMQVKRVLDVVKKPMHQMNKWKSQIASRKRK